MRVLIGLLAAGSLLPAQRREASAPAPSPEQEIAELAASLGRAHRPGAGAEAIAAFRAGITLEPLEEGEDSISVQLRVTFQMPRGLRLKLVEEGVEVERGNDPQRGAWRRVDGKLQWLTSADDEQEAEKVKKEVLLCRQLLALLDPAKVVLDLERPSPVARQGLKVSRTLEWPRCRTVSGTVASFPSYSLGEPADRANPPPARLTLWADETSKRLAAVRVVYLDAKGAMLGDHGELVLLRDYVERQGVALPTLVTFYRVDAAGRLAALVKVKLSGIELNPDIPRDEFKPR